VSDRFYCGPELEADMARVSKKVSSASDQDARVQRVLATVDSIPRGRVATYGDVAREAGLPRNARFVGRVLRRLPDGSKLPWHRVVNAAGTSSVTGSSAREQRRRLAREGVDVPVRGRIPPHLFVWRPSR
jgi:methylated-DNA-protein-cysteine methyltransferase-like protein